MTTNDYPRRNLVIPADLYDRAAQAAREQGVREQRTVSVSEWVREAMREKLEDR